MGDNQGRVEKRIDPQLMSGIHEWRVEPENEINFRYYVHEDLTPRIDMQHYRMISETSIENAKRSFAKLGNLRSQFKIPDTLKCCRTLARDDDEAYYLDAMDKFLETPSDVLESDIPILCRPLEKRLHCAFGRKAGYLAEHLERRRICIWLPFDHYENAYLSDAELTRLYRKLAPFDQQFVQPSALPIPVPFVVFYYYKELRDAQIALTKGEQLSQRAQRLMLCLRKEVPILFVATWILEACYGHRQFILEESTINALEEEVSGIHFLAGMSVPVIFAYMRSAVNKSENLHNWIFFKDYAMEESAFLWAKAETGEFDESQTPRQSLWMCRVKAKISLSQTGSVPFTRSTVLQKTITGPDYDKIEGLRILAREQRWERFGPVSFGFLLEKLVHLVRHYQTLLPRSQQPMSLQAPPSPDRDSVMRRRYTDMMSGAAFAGKEVVLYNNKGYDYTIHGSHLPDNVPYASGTYNRHAGVEYDRGYEERWDRDYRRASRHSDDRSIPEFRHRYEHGYSQRQTSTRDERASSETIRGRRHRKDSEQHARNERFELHNPRTSNADINYVRGSLGRGSVAANNAHHHDDDSSRLRDGRSSYQLDPVIRSDIHADVLSDGARTPVTREQSVPRVEEPRTPARTLTVTGNPLAHMPQVCTFRSRNQILHRSNAASPKQRPSVQNKNAVETHVSPDSPKLEVKDSGSNQQQADKNQTQDETEDIQKVPANTQGGEQDDGYTQRRSDNEPWFIMTRAQKRRAQENQAPDQHEESKKKLRENDERITATTQVESDNDQSGAKVAEGNEIVVRQARKHSDEQASRSKADRSSAGENVANIHPEGGSGEKSGESIAREESQTPDGQVEPST